MKEQENFHFPFDNDNSSSESNLDPEIARVEAIKYAEKIKQIINMIKTTQETNLGNGMWISRNNEGDIVPVLYDDSNFIQGVSGITIFSVWKPSSDSEPVLEESMCIQFIHEVEESKVGVTKYDFYEDGEYEKDKRYIVDGEKSHVIVNEPMSSADFELVGYALKNIYNKLPAF